MKGILKSLPLVICVFALAASASTNPRDLQWRFSGTTNNLRAVAASSQAFVAVGGAGTIVSSTDTVAWTVRSSGTAADLYGITYGNGMFVAVGGTTNAEVVTSVNGVDWTRQPTTLANSLQAVAWGANVFVAVGDQGAILVSTNGFDWSKRPTGLAKMLRAVVYANPYWIGPMFVAVGDGGSLWTSPDGLAWTSRSSGVLLDLYCVTAALPMRSDQRSFLAAGAEGIAIGSIDGITWTAFAIPTGQDVYAAAAAGAMGNGAVSGFALAGRSGVFLCADDATSWQTHISGTTANLRGVLHVDGEFLAVGDGGTIRCGRVYLRRNADTLAGLNSVTWGGGNYVAVGETGTVVSSPDGARWNRAVICPENLSSISYGANRFVAVGDGLRVAHSTNGQIWTTLTLPVPADADTGRRSLNKVAYGNGAFIVSGYYPILSQRPPGFKDLVFLSSDGENWQQVTNLPPETGRNYLVASAGPSAFLLSGDNLSSSNDGVAWTTRLLGSYYPIIYDGSRFMALSGLTETTTSLAFSSDGTVWTPFSTSGVVPTSALGYGDGIFVAIGPANGVRFFAESSDGTNWTSGVFSCTNWVQGVVFGDRSFVVVGSAGLILQSVPDTLPAKLQATCVDQGMDLMIISEPGRAISLQSTADLVTWNTGTNFVPTAEVTRQHVSTAEGNTKFFRVLGP